MDEELKSKFINDLDEWLKTDEHLLDCIGYSEGQACCLDKELARSFILKWMEANKTTFLEELVEKARNYGWSGDYVEVIDFVQWCFQEKGEKPPTDKELEPTDT
jgi:hypothetical protein